MKQRFKNPKFRLAMAALGYQAARYLLKKYGNYDLELGQYQIVVDLASYLFLGVGIYASFEEPVINIDPNMPEHDNL